MTMQQRHIEFLRSHSWSVDQMAVTRKYVVMTKPGREQRYFLGPNGAVRRGRTIAGSVPVRLKLENREAAE